MLVVNPDCKSSLSEEFVQVYSLADSIRTWMVSVTHGTSLSVGFVLFMFLTCYSAGIYFLLAGDEAEISGWQNEHS